MRWTTIIVAILALLFNLQPIVDVFVSPQVAEAQTTRNTNTENIPETQENMLVLYTGYNKTKVGAQQYAGGLYQKYYDISINGGATPDEAATNAREIAKSAYEDTELVNKVREYIVAKNEYDKTPTNELKQKADQADASLSQVKTLLESEYFTETQLQFNNPGSNTNNNPVNTSTETLAQNNNNELEAASAQTQTAINNRAAAQAGNSSALTTPQGVACGIDVGITTFGAENGSIMGCVAVVVYNLTLVLASLVLNIVGLLFNVSLNFSLNFGEFFNNPAFGLSGKGGAIYTGWSVIRDFINIFFIFILLYEAIRVIIGGGSHSSRATIVSIVTAALLINFSLFFTKVMVDTSNLLALQFYARINEAAKSVTNDDDLKSLSGGLSNAFRNALGLETIYKNASGKTTNPGTASAEAFSKNMSLTPEKLIMVSIGGATLMYVFAFSLGLAAVQFLLRTVVLIFLMMTSPLGFLKGAIPGIGKQANDWWSRLKTNLIFAPVYMAVLYLISKIVFGSIGGSLRQGGFIDLITNPNNDSFIGLIFWYVLVIALLIIASASARGMADAFGSNVTKSAESLMKNAPKGAWIGTKATWSGLVNNRAADAVINKVLTDKRGAAILSAVAPTAFNKLADRGLDRAKKRADSLWARPGEKKEDYENRKNRLVANAQLAQLRAAGISPELYDQTKDADGNLTKIEMPKEAERIQAIKDAYGVAQFKAKKRVFNRKEAHDYIGKVQKQFKKSSLKDKEAELKVVEGKIKDWKDFDPTEHDADIAEITKKQEEYNNLILAGTLKKDDIATLTYIRQIENELKAAQKARKKAESDHNANKEKLEVEKKKLERIIKEQEEKEESAKSAKTK